MNGNDSPRVGPFASAVIIVVLGAYFVWLLDRMAVFSIGGLVRLERLGVAIGLSVLGLIIALGAGVHSRRSAGGRRGRARGGSSARRLSPPGPPLR